MIRTQLFHSMIGWFYLRLYRLKEFIKEQLIAIPMGSRALVPAVPVPAAPLAQPPSPAVDANDPGAMLAGLLWFNLVRQTLTVARCEDHRWYAKSKIRRCERACRGRVRVSLVLIQMPVSVYLWVWSVILHSLCTHFVLRGLLGVYPLLSFLSDLYLGFVMFLLSKILEFDTKLHIYM